MRKMVFAIACLAMAGCGGGGGSSGSNTNTPNPIASSSSSSLVSSISSSASSSVLSSSSISSSKSSESSSNSSMSSSSSSALNNPLPLGAGTFATRFVVSGTYLINEATGVLTLQKNTLENNYRAADIDPAGMVIAVSLNGTNVDEIDLIKGTARTLFNAPEELSAIAISPDGVIVCVSKNSEFKKQQVYRFTNVGSVLSKVAIDEYSANGIDFDKNGVMYAASFNGLYELNPTTGIFKFIASDSLGQSDIDIDTDGVLRLVVFGELRRYSVSNGASLGKTVLQNDYFSFSPLVHR